MGGSTSGTSRGAAALLVGLSVGSACGSKGDGTGTGASDGTTITGTTTGDASTSTSGGPTSTTDSATTSSSTSSTSTSDTDSGGSTTSGGPKFDVQTRIDLPPEECIECAITIDSKQSGVFDVQGANIFATAELTGEVVYALGDYGSGRFIATADSSLPFNEVSDCPLHEWLAGTATPDPPVLWFGWTPSDGPKQWNVNNGTGAGVHLPAQYIGNPALLAQDFDIVMYLEASGQFDQGDQPTDAEMQTLLDYVQLQGGGLYVSSEFADPNFNAYLNQADLVSVNRLLVPLGLEALQVSLDWGNVAGNIDFTCFPAPEG